MNYECGEQVGGIVLGAGRNPEPWVAKAKREGLTIRRVAGAIEIYRSFKIAKAA